MGDVVDPEKPRPPDIAVTRHGKRYEVTTEAKSAAVDALRDVPTVQLRDMVRFLLPDVAVTGHPVFNRSLMLTLLTWAKENIVDAPLDSDNHPSQECPTRR
jgi:hypothetical protein